jgi:hypothetical protein
MILFEIEPGEYPATVDGFTSKMKYGDYVYTFHFDQGAIGYDIPDVITVTEKEITSQMLGHCEGRIKVIKNV